MVMDSLSPEGIRNRRIDCVVVKDLSRFGRNYVETGYYLEKIFPYLGVRFVAGISACASTYFSSIYLCMVMDSLSPVLLLSSTERRA